MATTFLGQLMGGGQAGAGFSNQSTNTSSNTNTSGSLNTTNTGTTTKNLTPFQSMLTGPLSSFITQLMTNPQATVAPFKAAARDSVNSTYSGLGDTLRQQFLGSTGGGQSGKFGMALAQGNLQRVGDLSKSDMGFDQTAAQLPVAGAGLAEQLLAQNFGQTTTGASSAESTGTSATTGKSNTSGFNFSI